MDILESLYLSPTLHTISSALEIPVIVLLLLCVLYALYVIGSILVEVIVERRRYSAHIPELVARLEEAPYADLGRVVEESGLLRSQKDDLDEMISYLYLPEDGRTEVAKRLLANEAQGYRKAVNRTQTMSKISPMLGLMATLIPLGPGIVAMGAGDTQTLADSLNTAFDGTVAGLVTAVVCLIVTGLRRRWYDDYLISMEAAFNTLLERARLLHEEGFVFEKSVYVYNKAGRRAKRKRLGKPAEEKKGQTDEQREHAEEQQGHTDEQQGQTDEPANVVAKANAEKPASVFAKAGAQDGAQGGAQDGEKHPLHKKEV